MGSFDRRFQSSFSEYDLWNMKAWEKKQSGPTQFQSSFSEYDLWNSCIPTTSSANPVISILVFWVWPLKRGLDRGIFPGGDELFQSSFSEYDLWNTQKMLFVERSKMYFNPRFLSMTFETDWRCVTHAMPGMNISILVFWVWPLKPPHSKLSWKVQGLFQSSFSEYDLWNHWRNCVSPFLQKISILVFWVWPLKHNTSSVLREFFDIF